MLVDSIHYSQHDGTPQEWKLEECTLGKINLIVGENASGKSKVLNIIGNLASVLCGDKAPFSSANYRVRFDKDAKRIGYILKCGRSAIVEERLDIDGVNKLSRKADGVGEIYYEKLGKMVEFQAPANQLVSVSRRDAIQHPFLGDLYDWGRSARHYYFGTDLGKTGLVLMTGTKEGMPGQHLNPKDTNAVVAIFIEGRKKFSSQFTDSIIQDMGAIGYELSEVGTAPPASLVVEGAEVLGLYVREADLRGMTDQVEMSQGMFRALSLIVQITYSRLANTPSCILIDDIGEGLDYNRSTALVRLLIEKAKETPVQLIMATNDRFVMNNVPLEYWSVVQRIGGISRIHNVKNSPEVFEEFQLTGLNNFDFFSSKYFLKDNTQN